MPGVDNLQVFPVTKEGSQLVIHASASALKKDWKRAPTLCSRDKEDKRVFVIVGGGAAGFECLETLRKEGYTGRLVLVGQEKHVPYDRTKLSKAMSISVDKILLRSESYYSDNSIELKLGVDVTNLNVSSQTLSLSDGSSLTYDKCFVATGGVARTLPVPGANLEGIFCLRAPEDASSILGACTKETKVVIVGSSFIGMEAAATLYDKVGSVEVVGMEKVPFERVLGAEIGKALQGLHQLKAKNITFHMERTVKEFRGEKGVLQRAILDDGTELEADVVVMGAGVVPSTKFFNDGVEKARDQSIVTDKYLQAAKNLFVGGDICRFPLPFLNNESVRIEHFGTAMFHGRIAALNMLDRNVVCSAIPYFWTAQHGKSVRYCGHALRYDNIIFDGDVDKLEFVAYYCSEGRVLAAASVSKDPVVSMVAELMGTDEMLSEKQLLAEIKKHGRVTLNGRV